MHLTFLYLLFLSLDVSFKCPPSWPKQHLLEKINNML